MTTKTASSKQNDTILRIFENISTRSVLIFLLLAGIIPSFISFVLGIISSSSVLEWWQGWLQNFSTEMFGGLLTFILFDLIIGRREKQRERLVELQEQQAKLLSKLRTASSADERQAILNEMNSLGLLINADLSGMSLQNLRFDGMDMRRVNLSRVQAQQCSFVGTNLGEAQFYQASLIQVSMKQAFLQGTDFTRAVLVGIDLSNCNLSLANMWGANGTNANLRNTQLNGAKLWGMDLRGADITGVQVDENTFNGTIL